MFRDSKKVPGESRVFYTVKCLLINGSSVIKCTRIGGVTCSEKSFESQISNLKFPNKFSQDFRNFKRTIG